MYVFVYVWGAEIVSVTELIGTLSNIAFLGLILTVCSKRLKNGRVLGPVSPCAITVKGSLWGLS